MKINFKVHKKLIFFGWGFSISMIFFVLYEDPKLLTDIERPHTKNINITCILLINIGFWNQTLLLQLFGVFLIISLKEKEKAVLG